VVPEGHKAARVRITGRVQGVWFRGWTVDQARSRTLDGWVRNRTDGSVEAIFVGEETLVDEMIAICREGPPAAKVSDVSVEPAVGLVVSGFHQKPTI